MLDDMEPLKDEADYLVGWVDGTKRGRSLGRGQIERGLLVLECGVQTVRLCPPLVASASDVDTALRIFGNAVAAVAAAVASSPGWQTEESICGTPNCSAKRTVGGMPTSISIRTAVLGHYQLRAAARSGAWSMRSTASTGGQVSTCTRT